MENQIPQNPPIPPQNIPTEQPTQSPFPKTPNINYLKTIGIGMSIVSFCIAIAVIGYVVVLSKNTATKTACTMEAKLCPNGTSVGRIGPKCEFAACPTTTPTPTIDPTANWKTYTNVQYGFSIKYPIAIEPFLQQDNKTYQGIGGLVNVDEWSLLGQPSYSMQILSYKEGINSKLGFSLQPQPTTTIQLANQTINKIVSVDETLVQVGPIKNSGNEYMIVYTSGNIKSSEGLTLFNQILSTFKFTQ